MIPTIVTAVSPPNNTLYGILTTGWGLAPELACGWIAARNALACQGTPMTISVISGRRTLAQERQLAAEGRPTASNPECSNHIPCPGTDVSHALDVTILPDTPAAWVLYGAAVEAQGLRWGGRFSPPDNGHVDEGVKTCISGC